LLVAATAAIALGGFGVAAVGAASDVTAADDSPLTSLGACMIGAHAGDLMLLMDESGSLDDSDPDAVRIDAAQYLLRNLASYAAEKSIELDIRISGFDIGYRPITEWTRLDAAALPALEATLDDMRDADGLETDYWTALEGARKDLAARSAAGDGISECQGLIWFSDGDYDVSSQVSDTQREEYGGLKPYAPDVSIDSEDAELAVEQLGRDSLCRDGGLADAARNAGVVVAAVGLVGPDIAPDGFGLLQRIATGRDDSGATCGAIREPQPGEFFLATDKEAIIFALERAGLGDGSEDVDDIPVCPGAPCPEHTYPFVLDASIRTVHILAGATEDDITISVAPPGGDPVQFDPDGEGAGTRDVGGHTLEFEWVTDKTIEIDMIQASGRPGWTGEWGLTFIDSTGEHEDAVARAIIRIKGDLVPAWPGAASFTDLRSGDITEGLLFAIQHEGSPEPVPPAEILGKASLSASLLMSDGAEREIVTDVPEDRLADPVTLDLEGINPGDGLLILRLAVTTAPVPAGAGAPAREGTELAEQVAQFPITVGAPPDFPTILDPPPTFPLTEGVGPATAALTVQGPGCVWVESVAVTVAPDGVGSVNVAADTATDASSCLEVADGETATLPLSLSVENAGNGPVAGDIQVQLSPIGAPDRALIETVEFTGELRRPIQQAPFLLAFIIAMVVGLGVPPLFLLAAKRWAARIPSGGGIWATTLPAVVEDGAVRLASGGSFDAKSGTRSFVTIGPKGQRELAIPEAGVRLSTKTGLNPFGSSRVVAEAAGGRPSVAGPAPHQDGDGRAVLPLAVHNHWIAWDGEPPTGAGRAVTVLVLASGTATPEVYERITTDVQEALPRLLAKLDGGPSGGAASQDGSPDGVPGAIDQRERNLSDDDDFAPPSSSAGLGGDDW